MLLLRTVDYEEENFKHDIYFIVYFMKQNLWICMTEKNDRKEKVIEFILDQFLLL